MSAECKIACGSHSRGPCPHWQLLSALLRSRMFPGRSTFFIFYDQNRPANGSPFGRAGAKRLRGQGRGQKGYL